jgi:hypothetical protein
MERIVETFDVDGHEVNVVEMIDEDRTWFDMTVDGALLLLDDQLVEPDRAEVTAVAREWLATRR